MQGKTINDEPMTFIVLHNDRITVAETNVAQRLKRQHADSKITVTDHAMAVLLQQAPTSTGANMMVRAGPLHAFGRVRLDKIPPHNAGWIDQDNSGHLHHCLAAYEKWGHDFTDHLAGDFCFVIWDDRRKSLLAVRDQLGVRPLYHAIFEGTLIVSDRLDWIVPLSGAPLQLDRIWIHDFLAHHFSQDPSRTIYADIKRVRPAHLLQCDSTGARERKYWTLAIGEPRYFAREEECTQTFVALVGEAITARLPEADLGISMSGGLDSPALAAIAHGQIKKPHKVIAYTQYSGRLIRDSELDYVRLIAEKLNIESICQPIDDLIYDADWKENTAHFPEPSFAILNYRSQSKTWNSLLQAAPVWFWGEGPDNALEFDWQPYMRWLAGKRDWRRMASATFNYLRTKAPAEWVDSIRPSRFRNDNDPDDGAARPWLPNITGVPDLHSPAGQRVLQPAHAWHPTAVAAFGNPILPALLSEFEPLPGQPAIEWRHPYMDLRVLEFMLSLPPIPWARHKYLIRQAMRGILPDAVLQRRKQGSPNPLFESISEQGLKLQPLSSNIDAFVDVRALPSQIERHNLHDILAVHVLDAWLQRQSHISF